MLRYISFSILFICFSATVMAQDYTGDRSQQTTDRLMQGDEEGTPREPKVKLPYPDKRRGTSLTFDITQLAVPIIDKGRNVGEVGIRTNFKERMFLVGAAGLETVSFNDKSYEYSSNGFYGKVGLDYDIFIVDEPGNNDNILIGLRYGFAFQEHESPSLIVDDGYWPPYSTAFPKYNVTSHWFEFVVGLRTQIINNFYMAAFVEVKGAAFVSNPELLVPYRIPGYGKGSSALNLGFSYQLEYQIPWGNKK